MSLLYTSLVGEGTRLTRPLMWLGGMLRHPLRGIKTFWPVGWSKCSVMFLVMQALDNAIALRAKKRWFRRGYTLSTEQHADKPNPTFIAAGNAAAAWLAQHTGGIAQSMILEAAANIQLAACIPNFLILESIQQLGGFHAKLLKTKIEWADGYVIPSKAPGLGVELNEEVALAHPYTGKGLHLDMAQHPLGYF